MGPHLAARDPSSSYGTWAHAPSRMARAPRAVQSTIAYGPKASERYQVSTYDTIDTMASPTKRIAYDHNSGIRLHEVP